MSACHSWQQSRDRRFVARGRFTTSPTPVERCLMQHRSRLSLLLRRRYKKYQTSVLVAKDVQFIVSNMESRHYCHFKYYAQEDHYSYTLSHEAQAIRLMLFPRRAALTLQIPIIMTASLLIMGRSLNYARILHSDSALCDGLTLRHCSSLTFMLIFSGVVSVENGEIYRSPRESSRAGRRTSEGLTNSTR